jgi:hypothetical protein
MMLSESTRPTTIIYNSRRKGGMKTRLRGFEFDLDPRDIVAASKQLQQRWGRKYAVQVDGGYYAPKDLMWSFVQKKAAGKL